MKQKTLEALQGSITKWEAIVAGTGKDHGPDNCPLCQLFHPDYVIDFDYGDDDAACKGCPVASAGFPGCHNLEYEIFSNDPTRQAAQDELEFLRGLLPKPSERETQVEGQS